VVEKFILCGLEVTWNTQLNSCYKAGPFLVGTDKQYTIARISIYPAIWALCFQNQGHVAGYAPCDAACPCRMES
jgi:hypothetical protein